MAYPSRASRELMTLSWNFRIWGSACSRGWGVGTVLSQGHEGKLFVFVLLCGQNRVTNAPMSRILLGVTGSIAAYKAADIASQLTKAGHSVTCILTKEAHEFVTPLVLRTLSKNPVISDLFAEKEGWQPGHIQLADDADLLLIAPQLRPMCWPPWRTDLPTMPSPPLRWPPARRS